MNRDHIFIAHASEDDPVVARVRKALEEQGLGAWDDARRMSGGDELEPRIKRAIEDARHVIAVLSPATVNSPWVTKEVKHALKVKKTRTDGFKVIPILLEGLKPAALHHWFPKEPLGVPVRVGAGGIDEAMPRLLDALGERLPTGRATMETVEATPIHDLVLELTFPKIKESKGTRRAAANATLTCHPATPGQREVKSEPFAFTAPIGPIEADHLSWYLERYAIWPAGVFSERAREIEAELPKWGRLLLEASVSNQQTAKAVDAWQHAPEGAVQRFSVLVDPALVADDEDRQQDEARENPQEAEANEAATLLLALPWELLHDGRGYLFRKAGGVRVSRRMPNYFEQSAIATDPPIRVLLVSPRPEDDRARYIDHRVSAKPLTEALASLGELAQLTILSPPTFPAMEQELLRARDAKDSYHVVHFDGHGVFDRKLGLGALCFEDPADSRKLEERRSQIIDAEKIAETIREHRIPLFFLDACQGAMAEEDPTASVAARLLQEGVASVVAMSHSVLVETARRFVGVFYSELVKGARVSQAMLAGQRELYGDTRRGRVFGAGDLHLQDWFVPVLYQEQTDPQLITEVPTAEVEAVKRKARKLALGDLPAEPPHTFVGRSRELLAAERLLADQPYVVLRGQAGEGKTTLAAELARWLVATNRFGRAAFVRLDKCGDARTVLDALGRQLVPKYSVAEFGDDFKKAFQPIQRALTERRTVIVLDNMESVLPPPDKKEAQATFEPQVLEALFKLFGGLLEVGGTRLIFTSREPMPEPFKQHHIAIGRLDPDDAVRLVAQVLAEGRLEPGQDDYGQDEDAIKALVEAVNCHARSLVLVAAEVGQAGVARATENLHTIMGRLQEKYPDDRERSLFASVELSLRRLPAETRKLIRPLGVFRDGADAFAIGAVLGLEHEEVLKLVGQLIDVGLAEEMEYSYLRLHAALCPYLFAQLDEDERDRAEQAWAAAMAQLAAFLYQQFFKDANPAAKLTLLELPNLLVALERFNTTTSSEGVIGFATALEELVSRLGRPKALARVVAVREDAHARLGNWGRAQFIAHKATVERLLEQGNFPEALGAAQDLLRRCETEGEDAYEGAAYELAMAHVLVGRSLRERGAAEAAVEPFDQAIERFQRLADGGDEAAARMVGVAISDTAGCLVHLGRLDDAAQKHQEAIELAEKRGDSRDAAAARANLGTVRMYQRRFREALAAHHSARETFEKLNEPLTVAIAWHQIGRAHQEAGHHEAAEDAYRKALAIRVREKDRSGEAATLNQLGILHHRMERHEDAVRFYRQATAIYAELQDGAKEGTSRSNLGNTLIKLERYDEARCELRRAIECGKPFGHTNRPWKTWNALHDLERAVGDEDAAAQARQQAVEAYLAYRRAGGESSTLSGKLCAQTAGAIAEGKTDQAGAELAGLLAEPDLPSYAKVLIPALQAILAGSRDPALAQNPDLDYDGPVELSLLLEHLTKPADTPSAQ